MNFLNDIEAKLCPICSNRQGHGSSSTTLSLTLLFGGILSFVVRGEMQPCDWTENLALWYEPSLATQVMGIC